MKQKLFKLDKEHFQVYNEYAKTKLQYTWFKKLIFSILGGLFIGIGYIGMLVIIVKNPSLPSEARIGLKIAGACMFPVGLLMCIYLGGNLFTSNCMGVIATVYRDKSIFAYFRDLFITLIGNLIGSMIISSIAWGAGVFGPVGEVSEAGEFIINLAKEKFDASHGHSWWNNTLSGILCNILVVGAIIVSLNTKKKGVGAAVIYLMLVVFVLSGYQHVVANMFIFSQAGFISIFGTTAETTFTGLEVGKIFYLNLIPSAIGNLLGGIIMSLVYLMASSYVFTRRNSKVFKTYIDGSDCHCDCHDTLQTKNNVNQVVNEITKNNQSEINQITSIRQDQIELESNANSKYAKFINVPRIQKHILTELKPELKMSDEECYTTWKRIAGHNDKPIKCIFCNSKNSTTVKISDDKHICYYCWMENKKR